MSARARRLRVLFVRSSGTRRVGFGAAGPRSPGLQTKRTKAQFWTRLRDDRLERSQPYESGREMMYVHENRPACMRVRMDACVLPPSMKYFHWFHGQQTRLHDANNTLHGAAVPFTSLPRGRANRARKRERE